MRGLFRVRIRAQAACGKGVSIEVSVSARGRADDGGAPHRGRLLRETDGGEGHHHTGASHSRWISGWRRDTSARGGYTEVVGQVPGLAIAAVVGAVPQPVLEQAVGAGTVCLGLVVALRFGHRFGGGWRRTALDRRRGWRLLGVLILRLLLLLLLGILLGIAPTRRAKWLSIDDGPSPDEVFLEEGPGDVGGHLAIFAE